MAFRSPRIGAFYPRIEHFLSCLSYLFLKKNDIDGKLSAKDIRGKLLKIYKGSKKYIPKERAIYNIIQKNKEKVIFDPIDSPWCIGSCEKYNIPADIVPDLIEWEQVGQPKFTNRHAKWFARLKPVVFEMSAAKRPLEHCLAGLPTTGPVRFPAPHDDSRFYLLAIITYQYAAREQIRELEGKQPDTSDMDFDIFTKGDIGADERGEPIHVNEEDWDPTLAFKSRFQTNTIIIHRGKEKK